MSDCNAAKPEAKSDSTTASQPLNLLDLQIKRHERHEHSQSHLGKAVSWASELIGLTRTDDSLKSLRRLKDEISQAKSFGDHQKTQLLAKQVNESVKADREALMRSNELTHYGAGLLKTASFFFPGRAGRIASALTCGLDQSRSADNLSYQLADGGLGALRGLLTHKLMNSLSTERVGCAGKGVLVGAANRSMEIALNRNSYLSTHTARFDLNSGMSRLAAHASDPAVWLADGATFAVAHGVVKGANKFSGGLIDSKRMLAITFSGTSFGMVTGALTELGRQRAGSEELDIGKIAARSFVQGGLDTVAALPGAIAGNRNFNPSKYSTNRTTSTLVAGEHGFPARSSSLRYELNQERHYHNPNSKLNCGNDNLVWTNSKLPPEVSMSNRQEKNATARIESRLDKSAPGSHPKASNEGTSARITGHDAAARSLSANRIILSDLTKPDGTRIVHKADGTVVTIGPNETIIERDGIKTTHRKDGPTTIEGPDGARLLRIIPRPRPDDCPLNVASQSKEGMGRRFSNFAQSRFNLDGIKYGSVEAFYTCLKITDPARRAEVAKLHGSAAKAAGREFKSKTGSYMEQTFELGSPEHHALVKRAIMAKFEQNAELGQALVQSHPRPITHNTGRPESPKTNYPAAVFIKTLTEVRDTLVKRANLSEATPLSDSIEQGRKSETSLKERGKQKMSGSERTELGSQTDLESGTLKPKPVWQILESVTDKTAQSRHDLPLYAWALKNVDLAGTKFVGAGANTVRIELADSSILKITPGTLTAEMGSRPFDLPILTRGEITGGRHPVSYFSQPKALPVTEENYRLFRAQIQAEGYVFTDPGLQQVGYYQGKVYLLDPFSVARLKG